MPDQRSAINTILRKYGRFRNELDIRNTYDPSPYLGLSLNANTADGEVPLCPSP